MITTNQTTSSPYDVVICDIDGCLSPETSTAFDLQHLGQVADHNRLAAEQRDRPIVTVCTGRPLPFAEAMSRLIQNIEMPLVAENGVWLYHPESNRYEIDPAIEPEHLEIVHEARKLMAEQYGAHGVTQQPGKTASVTLFHPDPEYLRSIAPAVEEEFNRRDWPFRVSMTWFYINCDLEHVSKASGVRRLLSATGIDPERTAGIGDTMSDLALAESVQWFACPANAREEIKRSAQYVSNLSEAAGVVDILQRIREPV